MEHINVKCNEFSLENDIQIEIMNNKQTNGQVRYSQKQTCVIAQVFGPNQTSIAKTYKQGIVDCIIKLSNWPEEQTKAIEHEVKMCFSSIINLKEYPNTIIKLFVTILQDEGNMHSAIINACMLALLVNGILLLSSVFAFELEFNRDINSFQVFQSEKNQTPQVLIVLDLCTRNVQQITCRTFMSTENLEGIYFSASQLISNIAGLYKLCLQDYIQK